MITVCLAILEAVSARLLPEHGKNTNEFHDFLVLAPHTSFFFLFLVILTRLKYFSTTGEDYYE